MQESNNEINSSKQSNKLKKIILSLCKNIYGYIKKLFLWSFHKIKESPESVFRYVGRFERTRIFLFLCYALFLLAIYSSANKFLNKNRDELDSRLEKILNMVEINEIANITIDIESILTVTNENIENQKILIDNILSDNLDEIEESINNNMEKQYSLMREYINQVVINNTNTTTFWLAFLSVIMVVFTILGLTINNNVLKQTEKDIAAVKQESEKAIKELIEEYKKSIEINYYFNLAIQSFNSRNYDDSINYYNYVIGLDKDNVIAYNNRGVVYLTKSNYGEAIKDINKSIELNPNYSEAYCSRGSVHNCNKNYDEAIKDCTKAMELNPNNSDAYNNRAFAYFNKLDYENAIKDIDKAIELAPSNEEYKKAKSTMELFRYANSGNNENYENLDS